MFPYKPLVAVPIACICIGFLFFHIAAFSCKTFNFDTDTASGIVKGGFWSYDGENGCERYPKRPDRVMQWGRAVGIMGALVAWPLLAVAALLLFRKLSWCTRLGAAYACMFLAMMSFFLLSGQASGRELKQGPGGTLAIFAALLWGVAAYALMKCVHEREGESESGKDRELVQGDAATSAALDKEAEHGSSPNKKRGLLAALGLGGAAAAGGATRGKRKSRAKKDDSDEKNRDVDDGDEKDHDIEEGDQELNSNEKSARSGAKASGAAAGFGLAGLFGGSRSKKSKSGSNETSQEKDIEADRGAAEDARDEEDDADVDGNQGDGNSAKLKNSSNDKSVGSGAKASGVAAGFGLAGLFGGSRSKSSNSKPREISQEKDIEIGGGTAGDAGDEEATANVGGGQGDEHSAKSKNRGILAGLGVAGLTARGASSGARKGSKHRDNSESGAEDAPKDLMVDHADEKVVEDDADIAAGDDDGLSDEKSGKEKKRGMLAGMGLTSLVGASARSKKKERSVQRDDDDDEDESTKDVACENDSEDADGKSDKTKKRGLMAGIGIAGLAAGAGSRQIAKDGEDANHNVQGQSSESKKKRGAFAGRRKKQPKEQENDDEAVDAVDDGDPDDAEENDDDTNDDEKESKAGMKKTKKRGAFSGRVASRKNKAKGGDEDEEIMDVGGNGEDDDHDDGEEISGKSKKRGILTGIGLAGIASSAGARKMGKPPIDQEEETNQKPKKKKSLFSGFNRKSQDVEEEEVEGAFPTSPSTTGENADAPYDAEERDLSAIYEEDSKAEEEETDVDSKKTSTPNKFLALIGVGGAAAAASANTGRKGGGEKDTALAVAVTGLPETQSPKDAKVDSSTSTSLLGARAIAAAGAGGANIVGSDLQLVGPTNDDDPLSPTDDENETLEQQADESFDKALGEQKKKGGLRKMLSRKSIDEVVEVSETMAVEVGSDGRKMRTVTTTTVMSSGAKTIKSRVEPIV